MWRLLNSGEDPDSNDEFFDVTDGKWEIVGSYVQLDIVADDSFPIRRKISEDSGTQPTVNQQSKAGSEDCAKILPFIENAICLLENNKTDHALDLLIKARAKLLPCS